MVAKLRRNPDTVNRKAGTGTTKPTNRGALSGKTDAEGRSQVPKRSLKTDPRVRRTRNALGDALIALMHERPFDDITVQHVLDRAGVSRAAFYAHFTDKDDLLLSDAEQFFQFISNALAGQKGPRVAAVAECFSHVQQVSGLYSAIRRSGPAEQIMELGREHFARGIEKRLNDLQIGVASSRRAIAKALAGAVFALLDWWIAKPQRESPKQMDELFHSLVAGLPAKA